MAIEIVQRKFWNQIRNGETFNTNTSDYTDYLLASLAEKIKTETIIDVFWKSIMTPYVDVFALGTSGATRYFTRQTNSFIADEFRIGDTIYYDAYFTVSGGSSSTHYTGTGTISMVSDLQMTLTSFTGGLPDTSTGNINSITIWGTTSLTGILFKYNLIENSEAENYLSKIDNNTLLYAGAGLSAAATTLIEQGNFKSWKDDGIVTVETGSSGVTGKQRFIITHTFWITPLYLISQFTDLNQGVPPSYFRDVKSLKYIANYELRQSLYNPNIKHGGSDIVQLGDTNWFNEHFNGFNPIEFTKDSISYDSGNSTELSVNTFTKLQLIINSTNNIFDSVNTNFLLCFWSLPKVDADYKNTLDTMFENYVFDQCFQTIGAVAADGIKSIITNVEAAVVNHKLVIDARVEFTAAQKIKMAGRQYIISVIIDDNSLTHATSKRVHVLMDNNTVNTNTDNATLLSKRSTFKFWEHPFSPTTFGTGTRNYKGWITDGVFSEANIIVKENYGILNAVGIKLIAYNVATNDNFELASFQYDLNTSPVINGNRIVSINTTRGFKLVTGSIRNEISINNDPIDAYKYKFNFGLKLRFEDWVQLLTANQDFFNPALVNNGQSQKWSNYSDIYNAWKIYCVHSLAIADVNNNGAETAFNIHSEFKIHDYNEDGNIPALWSASLETFEDSTSLGVDNAAKLSIIKDTKIAVTFTSLNALTGANMYGVIYIGQTDIDGIYTQWQLSTVELPAANNWLKPVTGETKTKLTVLDSNNVLLECMSDYTKVPQGNISIYARIGYGCQDIAEVRASNSNTAKRNNAIMNHTRSFDVYKNGVPVIVGGLVASPYATQDILDALLLESDYLFGYSITPPALGKITCTAPVGEGSAANGDVIVFNAYDEFGASIGTTIFTLAGGIDEDLCNDFITETEHILTENSESLLQENGDYLILE